MLAASDAVVWCRRLVALALLLQTLEFALVTRQLSSGALYPLPPRGWRGLFGPGFGWLLGLQAVLALLVLFTAIGAPIPALLATALLVGARFDGNFNGGSDRMTLVVLSGLTIELAAPWWPTARLVGLGWIAVQLTLSYFVAGLAKLSEPTWRNGAALGAILKSGHYLVPLRVRQLPDPILGALGFVTLGFELAFPLVFVAAHAAPAFLVLALGFHLANFFVLGLNRFFWAWLAAWPALLCFTS